MGKKDGKASTTKKAAPVAEQPKAQVAETAAEAEKSKNVYLYRVNEKMMKERTNPDKNGVHWMGIDLELGKDANGKKQYGSIIVKNFQDGKQNPDGSNKALQVYPSTKTDKKTGEKSPIAGYYDILLGKENQKYEVTLHVDKDKRKEGEFPKTTMTAGEIQKAFEAGKAAYHAEKDAAKAAEKAPAAKKAPKKQAEAAGPEVD